MLYTEPLTTEELEEAGATTLMNALVSVTHELASGRVPFGSIQDVNMGKNQKAIKAEIISRMNR